MGYYLVSTTTVSEFVAAMERMRVTQKIVIPVSVVFRFFPTVKEKYSAIRDAMKIRGITTLRSPMKMLEYRVVPLMVSIAKIGEELSAAALTRGLGAPQKRTNICTIGFGALDMFFFILSILCWAGFFISLEAVLVLQKNIVMVRSVDLARHMGFSKPSISHAVAADFIIAHIVRVG